MAVPRGRKPQTQARRSVSQRPVTAQVDKDDEMVVASQNVLPEYDEPGPDAPSDADLAAEDDDLDPEDPGDDSDPAQDSTGPEVDVPYVPVPPKGRIIGPNEALVFDGEPTVHGMIRAKEDVYRKVYPRGAKRPTYIQVVFEGSMVPARNVRTLSIPEE